MIRSISLSHLADISKGHLVGSDTEFNKVSVDTRVLSKGDLYFAIKGERFDGHQFISQAVDMGCSGLVVNESFREFSAERLTVPYVLVENTLKALGNCSQINRENFSGKVVGLTGSSGKTSTKNMLERILAEKGTTCATQGNFNNEIGVPLTLLSINKNHHFAVVEMGARRKGDIEYLSQFVKPDVAIILNAGSAHIDIFGSQDNIVSGKGEIFSSLKKDGLAVVNKDDPANEIWLSLLDGKGVLTFSVSDQTADVYATKINSNEQSTDYILNYQGCVQAVNLPVPGLHNVANSLAASAAAIHLGFEIDVIAKGLAKLNMTEGRLMSIQCSENLVVIDDSYNANPSSMRAAIDVLALKRGYKIAVLGEMVELGDFSEKFHLELANYISNSSLDKIYLIGPFASDMAEIIGERAVSAATKQDVFAALKKQQEVFQIDEKADFTTNILIKGSRSTAMDELVDMIVKEAAH